MNRLSFILLLFAILALLMVGCAGTPTPEAAPAGGEEAAPPAEGVPEKLTIAWIPKALNNPVFEVGRDGALKKAEELNAMGGPEVEVLYVGSVASDLRSKRGW
jgi:ABC-type sugar transport system substrate-binding protein